MEVQYMPGRFLQLKDAADPRKLSGEEARALLEAAPESGASPTKQWTGDAAVDADIQAYAALYGVLVRCTSTLWNFSKTSFARD